MQDATAIRRFAEKLNLELFYMRHGPELGPIEEEMPKDRLRPILVTKLKAVGVSLTDAELDFLVQNFPLIDVCPDDAHPNEDQVHEREVRALTNLLVYVIPDLGDKLTS